MELINFSIPRSLKKLVVAPLGDIQWSGDRGPTAQDSLKRHIELCLEMDAYFFGVGDYIDFMSPSNRQRIVNAGLYDTAKAVIAEKAMELNDQVYEKFLKPTTGRWIGMLHGHHFFPGEDTTSDVLLAEKLKTKFLGTSAFCRIPSAKFVLYGHHGTGAGQLPGPGLNKLYHTAAGLQGADVYLMGHNTKLATARLSRPTPVWHPKNPTLQHQDVWLVNCGGFSKSNIVRSRHGSIPMGDYAEQGMMTPSPLSAPIITVDLTRDTDRIRVSI